MEMFFFKSLDFWWGGLLLVRMCLFTVTLVRFPLFLHCILLKKVECLSSRTHDCHIPGFSRVRFTSSGNLGKEVGFMRAKLQAGWKCWMVGGILICSSNLSNTLSLVVVSMKEDVALMSEEEEDGRLVLNQDLMENGTVVAGRLWEWERDISFCFFLRKIWMKEIWWR